jgi:glucosyl-dolichyl phosphate glucuronosyltransferase
VQLDADFPKPLASVIVSCFSIGRLQDIMELLIALENQTYSNFEILLAIESSEELCRRLRAFVKSQGFRNLKIIFSEKNLGLSGGRNEGIKEANGDFIAIIDDDALPVKNWLETGINSLNLNESVIGATGPAIPLWKDAPLDWLPQELGWIIGASTWWQKAEICDVRHAWGMNMIFKRDAFKICGGFSESHGLKRGEEEGINRFPHEDVEFSIRVRKLTRKRIIFNPEMKVFHKVRARKMNILFFAKNAYVQGFAKRMVKELSRKLDDNNDELKLGREYQLLKAILAKVFPQALIKLPKEPSKSMRKITAITIVLSFLLIGYSSPFYGFVRRKKQKIPIIFSNAKLET